MKVGRFFVAIAILAGILAAFQVATAFVTFGPLQADPTPRAVPIVLMILALVTLTVSRGLLKRRRWARVALMCLLALVTAVSAVLLVIRAVSPAVLPTDGPVSYQSILQLIRVVDVTAPFVVGVACAWILVKMGSPAVRDVFGE